MSSSEEILAAVNSIKQLGFLAYESEEEAEDIVAVLSAFAEVVSEPEGPLRPALIWREVALIADTLEYLSDSGREALVISPKPEEVRDFIRDRMERIGKGAGKDRRKRVEVRARVNKDKFRELQQGKEKDPLQVFAFFGIP